MNLQYPTFDSESEDEWEWELDTQQTVQNYERQQKSRLTTKRYQSRIQSKRMKLMHAAIQHCVRQNNEMAATIGSMSQSISELTTRFNQIQTKREKPLENEPLKWHLYSSISSLESVSLLHEILSQSLECGIIDGTVMVKLSFVQSEVKKVIWKGFRLQSEEGSYLSFMKLAKQIIRETKYTQDQVTTIQPVGSRLYKIPDSQAQSIKACSMNELSEYCQKKGKIISK